MAVLDQHVAIMCRHGFARTAQIDDFTVDIRETRDRLPGPRHRVYFMLTVLSFGLGAILWLVVVAEHTVRRRRLGAEPFHAGTWRIHVAETGEIGTYELML